MRARRAPRARGCAALNPRRPLQLQGDCSAELRERDLLLKTAVAEADKTDKTIEVHSTRTRTRTRAAPHSHSHSHRTART